MKMKRAINLYLDEEIIEIGRKIAEHDGMSLSEYVADAIAKDAIALKEAGIAVVVDDKEIKELK
jgi:uncharacterized protein (DUF1778 family)